ncbi:hypothetical protein [Hymenobacter coccineus]|uniref:hypothetical protein n=1 Tax=Hymenobacter coccineus TaxID=1908235 RepID=UPI000F7A7C82|nr:hypothetical protein [Hymenobacter coccineus]
MDSYEVIRTIHKIGHPISGTVLEYRKFETAGGFIDCHIEIKANSKLKCILSYADLIEDHNYKMFKESLIPERGTRLDMVVKNCVDNTLYLSAKPSDTNAAQVEKFRDFYKFIDGLEVGAVVKGKVEKVVPFGVFINFSTPYIGLIDIGHIEFNGGKQLPGDFSKWPKEGEIIKCVVSYYRLHSRQIGLGWIPEAADPSSKDTLI